MSPYGDASVDRWLLWAPFHCRGPVTSPGTFLGWFLGSPKCHGGMKRRYWTAMVSNMLYFCCGMQPKKKSRAKTLSKKGVCNTILRRYIAFLTQHIGRRPISCVTYAKYRSKNGVREHLFFISALQIRKISTNIRR